MMKKKIGLAAMIGVLLVFGFMFVSCGGDEETDTWAALTDVNDLAGTWQGSTTINIPKQEIVFVPGSPPVEIPASRIDADITLTYIKDASTVTSETVAGLGNFLDALAPKLNMPKDTLWGFITLSEPESVRAGYKLFFTDSVPSGEFASHVEITQDGTKIRLSESVENIVGDFGLDLGGNNISITLSKK